MPDQKLSQLTAAASVAGSDQLYIVQGGQSKRATASQLPISTAAAAALDGKEATGTAAAAITAHLAAVDHASVSLGATVADVLGLTGQQLTADNPGAGADRLVFWDHSAGRLRYLALGSGLTITDTTIDAAGGTGGYPAFAAPTGFTVTGSGTASITLSFATGYSLPTTTSQASWDTAYSERLRWDGGATGLNAVTARASLELGTAATTDATAYATAAQGAKADAAVTAVTGTAPIASSGGVTPAISISAATTTAAGSMSGADKNKLDSIASGATANATDAQLRDRSTHTGTQTAATITGLASVATSGAYADLSGRPSLGTAAALNTGTAAGNAIALDGAGKLPAVDGSQLTNLPGGSGGTSSAVRIDSTSTANTIYVGKAPAGSSESSAVWSITRTQFGAAGVQTGSSTITAVTWTGRLTHTYP
jgi:hypothetical protein